MRIREEKTLITIEIFTLVFIVVASILSQVVDTKIKDYNDEIIIIELRRSHWLQLAAYHSQHRQFWELSSLLVQLEDTLGNEVTLRDVPKAKSENIDRETSELINKYLANEIDIYTYTIKKGNIYTKKEKEYVSKLNHAEAIIKNLRKNPPKFLLFNIFTFKSICLNIQLFGACLAIMLFVGLFIEINKRSL